MENKLKRFIEYKCYDVCLRSISLDSYTQIRRYRNFIILTARVKNLNFVGDILPGIIGKADLIEKIDSKINRIDCFILELKVSSNIIISERNLRNDNLSSINALLKFYIKAEDFKWTGSQISETKNEDKITIFDLMEIE